MSAENCIFCKIVAGKIPSRKVYEDDQVLAFHDIAPKAPVHFLIVPKQHVDSLAHCTSAQQSMLGSLMLLTNQLALQEGLKDGYRTTINTGAGGGQEVFHLHLHVTGGR